ncbi:MAG: DUF456 domain-containing protein [Desulfitobacteriia bacterium]
METFALIVAIIFFIAGLIGTVLPVLPGVSLILAGMLIYGIMTGFVSLDFRFFLVQIILFLFVFSLDYLASALGARHFGGSKKTALGAVIGTILGLLFLGPLGILVGPFAGSLAVELLSKKSLKQAVRAGLGTIVGLLGGLVIKYGVEFIMIIYFFISI